MEESEISFEPSEGYDTLGTLKELAAQVRSATEDSENTAERVGRVFAGILDLLEQSGIEFDTAEGDDSIEILQSLSDQVRGATRKGENTSERGASLCGYLESLGNESGGLEQRSYRPSMSAATTDGNISASTTRPNRSWRTIPTV